MTVKRICFCVNFFWLIMISNFQAATAAELYVSTAGNDSSNCLINQPCRQIRRALALAQAGDTVFVSNGTYLGFTARNIVGTVSTPVTIKAQGSNVEILPTSDRGVYEDRDNIYLTFCEHLIIDGLRTYNAPRAGMRIDASHFITVRNSRFGNNGTWGIFTNHSNNVLLENNEAYGSGKEHGIYLSNSGDRPTVRGNSLHDNHVCGLHMNGDLSAGGHGGVLGDGIISDALIENNTIFNNGSGGGSAINMDGVQDSTIRNNLLYNNQATGIVAYRIDGGSGPGNLKILNNTVDMAETSRYAVQVSETTGPIKIRNNILYVRDSRRGGLAYGLENDVKNVDSDYNIFGGTAVVAFNDWTIRRVLSEWQAQGYEQNSFSAVLVDLFVDPDGRNYHLRSQAPAIDKGEVLTEVGNDADGKIRPVGAGFDIGAYEYGESGVAPAAPSDLSIASK
jgi:parallel beta-helix repeat protein